MIKKYIKNSYGVNTKLKILIKSINHLLFSDSIEKILLFFVKILEKTEIEEDKDFLSEKKNFII